MYFFFRYVGGKKLKIRLFGPFWPKTDFLGKNRTNLEVFFFKGPLSDQGLIKRTYLAALLLSSIDTFVHLPKIQSVLLIKYPLPLIFYVQFCLSSY